MVCPFRTKGGFRNGHTVTGFVYLTRSVLYKRTNFLPARDTSVSIHSSSSGSSVSDELLDELPEASKGFLATLARPPI